jgi:hypothetical protein
MTAAEGRRGSLPKGGHASCSSTESAGFLFQSECLYDDALAW